VLFRSLSPHFLHREDALFTEVVCFHVRLSGCYIQNHQSAVSAALPSELNSQRQIVHRPRRKRTNRMQRTALGWLSCLHGLRFAVSDPKRSADHIRIARRLHRHQWCFVIRTLDTACLSSIQPMRECENQTVSAWRWVQAVGARLYDRPGHSSCAANAEQAAAGDPLLLTCCPQVWGRC
jgi:hypothetical protein